MSKYLTTHLPGSKQDRNVEQLARECLAEAHGNPERAIALARLRLRESYLAQIKRAGIRLFRPRQARQPGDREWLRIAPMPSPQQSSAS